MEENQKDTHAYYFGPASLSPVPLSVSSPVIKPENRNQIKTTAVESMQLQAAQQIEILRRQAQAIVDEIRKIEMRLEVSYEIYEAEIKFKPVVGKTYFLYEKHDKKILSLIGPDEWGKNMPFDAFKAEVKLLANHTWEVNAL